MTPNRFDIYVRRDGRWQRQESLPGDDLESAVGKAGELDGGGGFDGVRVMAVVEYGSGRPPLETLAWISPHLSSVASVQRQMRSQAAAAGKALAARSEAAEPVSPEPVVEASDPAPPQSLVEAPSSDGAGARPKGKRMVRAATPVAGKLALNGFIALAAAAVAFVPITALLRALGGHLGFDGVMQQRIAVALTLLIFVSVAAALMGRVYRAYRAAPVREPESAPEPARTEAPMRAPRRAQRRSPPPEGPPKPSETDAPPQPNKQDEEPKKGGGLTEAMRRTMLEFLAAALTAIKDEVPRMNQHVAFGLNLFGSGAAERYGEHAGLNRVQSFVLIRETVEALGNPPDRVDAYCRQYGEYRQQDRYRVMVEAGRETMSKKIDGDPDPFADISDVVQMWTSDAAARAQSQGIVCIMFTDLVGSTQMTHERGDYAAQEVVRIHNAIVRSALAAHHGREVKHTGDGIMASFSVAANAVRAAVEIQATLKTHNAKQDALPVGVRIGLNAGEAVQEEDDFFGTTVQLAARVCDKAGTGEAFVTDNVRELSKGQGLNFEDAGEFEMKGVPQPMTLYRVVASGQGAAVSYFEPTISND